MERGHSTIGTRRKRRPGLAFYLYRPLWWPRRLRRAALLTLPLSLALWLAVAVLAAAALLLVMLGRPVRRFWNAPRRVGGYGYFEYSCSERGRNDGVPAE